MKIVHAANIGSQMDCYVLTLCTGCFNVARHFNLGGGKWKIDVLGHICFSSVAKKACKTASSSLVRSRNLPNRAPSQVPSRRPSRAPKFQKFPAGSAKTRTLSQLYWRTRLCTCIRIGKQHPRWKMSVTFRSGYKKTPEDHQRNYKALVPPTSAAAVSYYVYNVLYNFDSNEPIA